MGRYCYNFSPDKPGYIERCELDANGDCTKNCKYVKVENVHPRIASDWKRLQNTVKKWDPDAA